MQKRRSSCSRSARCSGSRLTRGSRGRTVTALAIMRARCWLRLRVSHRRRQLSSFGAARCRWGFGHGFDRTDLVTRGLAALAGTAAFIVVASPILRAYQSADNVAHVAILGLSDPSREPARVAGSAIFVWQPISRWLPGAVIEAIPNGSKTASAILGLGEPAYTKWSDEYYRRLITTFPGDMLVRAWAAVLRGLPVAVRRGPTGSSDCGSIRRWMRFFQYRGTLLSWLAIVPPIVAAGILAVGTTHCQSCGCSCCLCCLA